MMDSTRMLGTGENFGGAEFDGHDAESHPLQTVHLLLQGRYWMTLLVVALGLAGAGVLGYRLFPRYYACTGTIHIKPVLANPLFDKNGMMPMYESYVQTQVARLKSEGVVENALSSQQWLDQGPHGANRSDSPATMDSFRRHLTVVREGELIRVTFADPDQNTAAAGVSAVTNAYAALGVDGADSPSKQLAQLESLRDDYQRRVRTSDDQIAKFAGAEGADGVKMQYSMQSAVANQAKTEWELAKSSLEMWAAIHGNPAGPQKAPATEPAAVGASAGAGTETSDAGTVAADSATTIANSSAEPAAATQPVAAITAEDIARQDRTMAELLDQRDAVQLEIDQFSGHVGPSNAQLQDDQRKLQTLQQNIDKRVAAWKPELAAERSTGITSEAMTIRQLQAAEAAAHNRYSESYAELIRLAGIVSTIKVAEDEQQQDRDLLDRTKNQIEELRVEAAQSGRIEQWPVPSPALKDYRLPVAAGSGLGGGLLALGVMLILGLTDRRLRTVDQARMSLKQGGLGLKVLGMLPSLPKNLEDPSAASFAALCVHHIRMLLQVMPRLDGHPAIAITSPAPGDGKTSLTLALALSYAASGKSTLLIDCDIVGAGLTRRVNAIIRRRVGQILIREKLITPAQLREALQAAQRTGRKLGEVLVDEGMVERGQLDEALKTQGETSVGLLDVLRGEVLEDCVADTGTPRLWILPIGSALAEQAATISPEGFRNVLEQARSRFEAILIDTGPIPGSIESSVAASQADGVVLAVSRGEQGPLVRRASEHVRDIGGRTLGIVFNRATPEDFSSSYGAISSPSIPERPHNRKGNEIAQFGPVAAAVAGQQKRN